MKIYSGLFIVLLLLIPVQQARAQDQIAQETALLKLQELGFTRGKAIYGEDFIDQIKAGNLEVVRLFLAAGVSPDVRNMHDLQERNALLIAAEHGHADVVKVLVEAGADISEKDKFGRTPLVVAVMREHDHVVHVLLGERQKE